MGWWGFGIYDGDETQSCHEEFLKRAGYKERNRGEISEFFFKKNKTNLNKEAKILLIKNFQKVLDKMPKIIQSEITKNVYFKDESDAIEWQMLLALCLDNKIKPPKLVKDNAILATEYLLYYHADSFTDPSGRKTNLKRFLSKAVKS